MGNVTSEKIVGTHEIDGRTVLIQASTWNNTDGVSYDVIDPETMSPVSADADSFCTYPSEDEIREVLEAADEIGETWECPGCHVVCDAGSDAVDHVRDCDRVDGAGHRV